MQKYFFLLLCLLFSASVFSQEELDSTNQKDDIRLKDLIWIKDTTFFLIKNRRFSSLKLIYPSFKTYRQFIDTSYAGSQSDITQYAMYNKFWNRLRLQYTKLHKKSSKAGVEWDKTILDSFHIDTGGLEGNEYVYINWIVKYNNKKRYVYSALFLKMKNKWFLMDELKYMGIVPEKKKRKPVKKK